MVIYKDNLCQGLKLSCQRNDQPDELVVERQKAQ